MEESPASAHPTLVYDDDCGFCTRSALLIARGSEVGAIGFSEVDDELLVQLPDEWRRCAHLVTEDGIYSCGEAMERAYGLTDLPLSGLPSLLRRVPGYEMIRNVAYRFVASHRPFFSRLTQRLF